MESAAVSTRAVLAGFDVSYAEVVSFLARRTGNIDEARGLAHDAWLRLAERERSGEALPGPGDEKTAPADPKAYLFTVAHHLAMDHLRRGNWLQSYVREGEAQAAQHPPHTPDVADSVMYRQALAAVEAALHALPHRAREVFLAHRVHDESQSGIAARLGVSLNTVERDMILAGRRIESALHAWRGTPQPADTARPGRRKSLGALLGLAVAGVAGSLAWHLKREAMRWQLALATARGQSLERRLPDGSRVTLDAQSRIAIAYDAGHRAVRLLQGAAFFAVERDPDRPFTVEALGVQVTVLGTRFGVEIRGRDNVLVQVESGHVRVRDADGGTYELRDGQGLRLAPHAAAQPTTGPAALWRSGELEFDATPLDEAVARMARYANFELRVAPQAAALRISGRVRIAEARDWLSALPSVLPVRVVPLPAAGIELALR